LDGREGHPYRLLRSDFREKGRCAPMSAQETTKHEKTKQEQLDEIEKIEMCGDVIF
jgi:hypothetical protein